MKIYKKLIISSFVSLFCLISSWAQSETLEDLAKEVNNIQAELKSLPTSSLEEAVLIDNAIKVIDQAANLVTESINKGDNATALSTINFLNKSIGDIVSQTPKDFITEKTASDLSAFSKEDMKEIQTITQSMKVKKKEKMKTLVQDMTALNQKGVDAVEISKELNNIGIETITPEQVRTVAKTISKNQIQSLTEVKTVAKTTTDIKPEEKFSAFVGETDDEVSMSLEQVDVLKSGDNVKQRAYDIEKVGKMVGLTDNEIKQGVSAVKEGDWEGQKEIVAKIYEAAGIEVTETEINEELEEEMINDTALQTIMNGEGKDAEELAQEVKNILSNNKNLSEATVERVYYTVLYGANPMQVYADQEVEVSYNDIAAEAKAKMSEDPDIERAFYATQQRTDWSGAFEGTHLEEAAKDLKSERSDIEVAAEVAAIMSGDNDKQVEFYEAQGTTDWSNAFKDNATMNAAAEAAKEASSETTEAVAEVSQEVAAETTEVVAEVSQEVAAETTEVAAEVAQEVSQEVAEVAQEVSQEVAEVAQEVSQEVAEIAEEVAAEVEKSSQELLAEWNEAQKEWTTAFNEAMKSGDYSEVQEVSKKTQAAAAAYTKKYWKEQEEKK